jgi:hypothetical protein
MVDLIDREFAVAGYDRPIIVAAVANSYVESRGWDPLAHTFGPKYKKTKKKTEDSAGLFQLNRMGGHGEGMPMGSQYPVGPSSKKGDSRYDPKLNIRRILEVMRTSTAFSKAQYDYGHDAVKMAGEFCKIIELPKDPEKKAKARQELVEEIFPQGWSGTPESIRDELPEPPPIPEEDEPFLSDSLLLWGIGLSVTGLVVTAMMRQHAIKTGQFVPMKWGA